MSPPPRTPARRRLSLSFWCCQEYRNGEGIVSRRAQAGSAPVPCMGHVQRVAYTPCPQETQGTHTQQLAMGTQRNNRRKVQGNAGYIQAHIGCLTKAYMGRHNMVWGMSHREQGMACSRRRGKGEAGQVGCRQVGRTTVKAQGRTMQKEAWYTSLNVKQHTGSKAVQMLR
jgi:hypothetical protein